MNLANVETFLAVIDAGSLSRASERLNVTQSTVTARLSALEDEVGQRLFHRRKSGAELTSAGFKFQRYAELMSNLWGQALLETSLPDGVEAICNVGCHGDLWPALGDALIERLESEAGGIAFSAWPGDHHDLERWLRSGLIDVALGYAVPRGEDIDLRQIGNDRLLLVSTAPRPLMRWDTAYVYVDMGEQFRRDHAAAYPDGDTPVRTFGSAVWALDYLKRKGGSAYLPERLIVSEVGAGHLFPVDGAPAFERPVYLAVHGSRAGEWPWFDSLVESFPTMLIGGAGRQYAPVLSAARSG